MKTIEQGRATVLQFDALTDAYGRPLSVAIITPSGKGELREHLQGALDQLSAYDAARAQATKLHYDPVGVEQHVAPIRAKAQRAVETATVWAKHAVKTAAERRAELYAPPKLDATDYAGAHRDGEIRARYGAMSADEKAALHKQLQAGQLKDVLTALARDPMADTKTAAIVKSIWEPHVERERAEDVAKVDAAEQEATAALENAAVIQRALDRTYAAIARPPLEASDPTYGASV